MSEERKKRLSATLRKRISSLPEGPFKRRMEMRANMLDEVPPEAWIGLALVLLAMLGLFAYSKLARLPKALALL